MNGVHWLQPAGAQTQNAGFGYLAAAILADLRQHGAAAVWSGPTINMRATPSLASESAHMILRIVDRDRQGIFHCIGGEAIERIAFARLVAATFGYDPAAITVVAHAAGVPDGVRVPYDTSLTAPRTARELEYRLPGVRELLAAFMEQVTAGRLS